MREEIAKDCARLMITLNHALHGEKYGAIAPALATLLCQIFIEGAGANKEEVLKFMSIIYDEVIDSLKEADKHGLN